LAVATCGGVTALASTVARGRDELVERAGRAENVGELFARASERLRRIVPFDAAVWLAFDPATSLPTSPTRSENLGHVCNRDAKSCLRVWELEFLVEDVNLYRDLARADTPARGLRQATHDRPARSTRYREFLRPNGFDDELRAVMRIDGGMWASVGLFRERGRAAFEAAETDLVASVAGPLAAAVRDHARPAVPARARGDDHGPGLLVFTPTGELISINDDARAWLDELPPEPGEDDTFCVRLPLVVAGTLMRARAIAEERDHGVARARLRSRSGRWLVFHASCLRDTDGELGNTAVVIEPAKASEIAPIITQAYRLSTREQQITQLVAQGLATADIADRLYLSTHTVRDYIKAIFEKVGVSSRGELVATLFAEHYAPTHFEPGGHTRIDP
jgi:DNA-binding CsgD family transcriptional regulator